MMGESQGVHRLFVTLSLFALSSSAASPLPSQTQTKLLLPSEAVHPLSSTSMPWTATGRRAVSFIGGQNFSRRPEPRRRNRVRSLAASAAHLSTDANGTRCPDELELKLRRLALLNGGNAINPRSPRQVSNLLYGNSRVTRAGAWATDDVVTPGPTDKVTLQRMLLSDADDNEEMTNQREVAALVLRCRELLSSSKNNGNAKSSCKSSRVTRTDRGAIAGMEASYTDTQSSSFGMRRRGAAYFSSAAASAPVASDDDCSEMERDTMDKDSSSPHLSDQASMSPYERSVMRLFRSDADNNEKGNDTIDPYWMEPLLSLTKSSSRGLVEQLQPRGCPMGFDPSAKSKSQSTLYSSRSAGAARRASSPLLSSVRSWKLERHPDAVLLVRVGDFYETYGLDAILLVEHCGLNPMSGKAKAGCPWRNVQATLDCLTGAGFRVAVYEEWDGEGDAPGEDGGGGKLKRRYLRQVVSPGSPTYMHGLVLSDDGSGDDRPAARSDLSSSPPGRSYVGVIENSAGYSMVEINVEERTVIVSERLTAEAVSCRLTAFPPADPLFYVPPALEGKTRSDRLPFLPWRQQAVSSLLPSQMYPRDSLGLIGSKKVRVKRLQPDLVIEPRPGLTDVERAKQTIVNALLRLEGDSIASWSSSENKSLMGESGQGRALSHADFVLVSSTVSCGEPQSEGNLSDTMQQPSSTMANPLHLETATQLGLMSDPSIPPLISSILPDSAPVSSRRFLRRWLLVPPPNNIADAMSQLVKSLKDKSDKALPSFNAPPLTGKETALVRAGQASASVFRNIVSVLDAASEILLLDDDCTSRPRVVDPLLEILRYDAGILDVSDPVSLRRRFLDAKRVIEDVVSVQNGGHLPNDHISHHGDVVPFAFFERNEATWRGRVRPKVIENAPDVPLAAKGLAEAIAVDFWGVDVDDLQCDSDGIIDSTVGLENKNPVVQDIFNNLLAIKSIPKWADEEENDHEGHSYFHPRDRFGKLLPNRYTTERVQNAMCDYVQACAKARSDVEKALTRLAMALVDDGHLPVILQASHLNLILRSAAFHAGHSNAKGWHTANVAVNETPSAGFFNGVWPHWMDRSTSVPNSFDLEGLFLITAPNMSGKSTLMRSTAAAALLVNCGLCAPVGPGSRVRRFDSIFVRGASADVPTEGKSAFGAEMGDISSLLRSCGSRSLVFVDEIGRGTSPKDGTSLAGAILEAMAERGMSGMFATHLHDILNLPISSEADGRLQKKRMAVNGSKWLYTLEDGVCTNSLALVTAAKFGLPEGILKRAEELSLKMYPGDAQEDVSQTCVENMMPGNTSNSFSHAITILEEVGKISSIQIPPSCFPPSSYEGTSCVYVLQIPVGGTEKYYVGETDSLARRLPEHRLKDDDWSSSTAAAIKVGDKSNARSVESQVIQRMAKSGFNLINIQSK